MCDGGSVAIGIDGGVTVNNRCWRVLLGTTVMSALLASCTLDDGDDPADRAAAARSVTMPTPRPGEVVILDRLGAFAAYDPATGALGARTDVDGYFAYELGGTQPERVTAGNSTTGGFAALRRAGDGWVTEAEVPEGEALFPLAGGSTGAFYVRQHVDDPSDRSIVQLTDERLVALGGAGLSEKVGDVVSGAVVRDRLYVASYVEERDEFILRSLDPGADDVEASLRVVDPAMGSEQLLSDGERLWRRTAKGFRVAVGSPRPVVACRGECAMDQGHDVLFDRRLASSDIFGARLAVSDTATGKQIALFPRVLDYQVRGDALVHYRDQGRETVMLADLRSGAR